MLRKLFAIAILLVVPVAAGATAKFAKDTKKACTVCHVKAGKPGLNNVGKCFKANKNQLGDCEKKAAKK